MSSETFHARSSTRAMEYSEGSRVEAGDAVEGFFGISVANRNGSSEPCSRVADEVQTPSAHISSAVTTPALPLNSTSTVFVHPMAVQTPGDAHPETVKLPSSTAARPKKRIFPMPANIAASVVTKPTGDSSSSLIVGSMASEYRVGIYGARNVCSQVSDRGLAVNSFVSGMSTGFSGNLGYPLPRNWAFDQILEYSIGAGAGAIGIDKNIKSGRDQGQGAVDVSPPPPAQNSELFKFLFWLQIKAEKYKEVHSTTDDVNQLVLSYLRTSRYADGQWALLAGPRDGAWLDYVSAAKIAEGVLEYYSILDPETDSFFDTAHLFGSTNVYWYGGHPDRTNSAVLSDLGGLGG